MLPRFKNPEVIILIKDSVTGEHHFERLKNVCRVQEVDNNLEVKYNTSSTYIISKAKVEEWKVIESED